MGPVVSVFNNKGGVGKTVISWNLADTLARRGRSVLLIDFDPQCNLSIAVLGETVFNSVLPTQNVPYGTTIRAFIQRFLQNTGGQEAFTHRGRFTHDNVRLIAGDFWLNVYADSLSLGGDLLTGTGISKFLVLRRLIEAAEQREGRAFDFVFIDLPPSFGSIVRAALYCSDYFIVPCTSDNFSAYCVGLIGEMLPVFSSDWETGLDRFRQGNPHFTGFNQFGRPKFAGWVFNGFDIRRDITPADRAQEGRIVEAVEGDLIPRWTPSGSLLRIFRSTTKSVP